MLPSGDQKGDQPEDLKGYNKRLRVNPGTYVPILVICDGGAASAGAARALRARGQRGNAPPLQVTPIGT